MSDGTLKASVVLPVFAEVDGYEDEYGVTMKTVGSHLHGPLVKFSGTRDDLRYMVAEVWLLKLSFDSGPTLTDLEED